MSRNVFTVSGDRSSVTISPTTKGLKIETVSAYTDEQNITYYITSTLDYNKNSKWDAVVNDYGTKLYQCLLNEISGKAIKPYRIIKK